MISDKIPRVTKSLQERGLPQDSYFSVVFNDNSEADEREVAWSSFCDKKLVNYFGGKKTVNVSKYIVKKIRCVHDGLEAEIDVPRGCEAYQAIRSEAVIIPNVQRRDRIIGRIIGIIKDGKVIEEKFLNALQYKVEGFKK